MVNIEYLKNLKNHTSSKKHFEDVRLVAVFAGNVKIKTKSYLKQKSQVRYYNFLV